VLLTEPFVEKSSKFDEVPRLIACPKIAFGINSRKPAVNVKSNFVFIVCFLSVKVFSPRNKGIAGGVPACYITLHLSCIIHMLKFKPDKYKKQRQLSKSLLIRNKRNRR